MTKHVAPRGRHVVACGRHWRCRTDPPPRVHPDRMNADGLSPVAKLSAFLDAVLYPADLARAATLPIGKRIELARALMDAYQDQMQRQRTTGQV